MSQTRNIAPIPDAWAEEVRDLKLEDVFRWLEANGWQCGDIITRADGAKVHQVWLKPEPNSAVDASIRTPLSGHWGDYALFMHRFMIDLAEITGRRATEILSEMTGRPTEQQHAAMQALLNWMPMVDAMTDVVKYAAALMLLTNASDRAEGYATRDERGSVRALLAGPGRQMERDLDAALRVVFGLIDSAPPSLREQFDFLRRDNGAAAPATVEGAELFSGQQPIEEDEKLKIG